MAIIYSYPTVTPTSDDLVLGTDVNGEGKPTKNFTIQSIVDIVQGGATGLGAVLTISSDALQQPATNFTNVQGTGTSTFGSFTDGTMTITNGVGTGFTAFTSTAITGTLQTAAQPNVTSLGNLTGLVINGAISGTNVITSTTLVGASNTNIASTLAIKTYVDSNPSGAESLAATLLIGNTTSGTDIAISAADDITFTDTSKIIMGAGGDTTIEHDGTDFKITTITGKNTVSNTSGDIDITASATGKKININGKAGVDLKHDGSTKLQAISGGVQVTGVVDVPNGTSGAPTYSFTTDTNTGMFRSAADTVAFSSGGNLTMTISTSGVTTEGELTAIGQFRCLSSAQAIFSGQVTVALAPSANTDAASKAYVDGEVSAKTLDYAGDATGPFALNLSTDDLEFNGDSNITVTAAAVAATKGIVTIDLNNDVGISGTMTAGTFTDGTFTGSSGTYTGYTSITSAAFVGPLTGNATTATALATAGTIQLLSGSGATQGVASNAVTYTDGGNIQLTTTLADTTVTAKALTNLPTPTSSAITASDTILAAMAKLQGQITSTTGLAYEGTWDARNSAEGGSSDGGNPDLTQASTKVNGHFYIVSTAGNAEPNGGAGTQLSPWAVGDWVIYVANGSATDEWQKLDQSNEVLGSGAANKIAKWTATNTLGTGLISDDGTDVTIGTNGNLIVQGDTTLGDDAAADTITLNGPTTFESTGRFKKGLALGTATDGSEYGATGQVLTASTSAGSPPTWTTPTVGVVTSITGNYGITVAGTAAVPTVAVTADTNNLINQATAKATPVGADTILINDSAASDVLKKATLTSIKTFTAESWLLDVDGGTAATISDGDQVGFNSGTGIIQTLSTKDVTTAIDYVGNNNAIEAAADGTSITVAATDKLWVSDADDNTIKQINVSQVSGVLDQGLPDVLAINNASGANDIVMADSQKITFGAAPDLQLFHDASNSYIETTSGSAGDLYIKSNGTGHDLYLQATDDVFIRPQSSNDGIKVIGGGAVELYHNGIERLKTTSTGVEVVNTDVNVSPTILLNQDSKNFIITQSVTGGGQITNSFGSLALKNDGSINLQNNAGTYTKASFDSSISFSPDNLAGTATVPGVTIYQSTDATADGTRTRVYGNLQVDGNIIHADAGNSGTYNFDDTVNASSNENIFSITGGDGACAFTVYFTCNTGSYSVAKVYTVVHSYGTTVVYNKLVDSGPYGGHDFTPTFTGATNVLTCNIANGSGSISANISTTVILGASPQNLTVAAL
jgi:hypothetical protein